MYALKTKGKWEFFCVSKTEEELKSNEAKAFNSWRSAQAKDSSKAIDDFMKKYDPALMCRKSITTP